MQQQISTYEEVDTLGRSQVELILKVYNGALGALKSARAHYERLEWPKGYEELEKARKFIVHLYSTLDFAEGGEVATNLGRLYVFLLAELDAIEATKDLAHLDSCVEVLNNLKAGWEAIRPTANQAGPRRSAGSTPVTSDAPFLVEA